MTRTPGLTSWAAFDSSPFCPPLGTGFASILRVEKSQTLGIQEMSFVHNSSTEESFFFLMRPYSIGFSWIRQLELLVTAFLLGGRKTAFVERGVPPLVPPKDLPSHMHIFLQLFALSSGAKTIDVYDSETSCWFRDFQNSEACGSLLFLSLLVTLKRNVTRSRAWQPTTLLRSWTNRAARRKPVKQKLLWPVTVSNVEKQNAVFSILNASLHADHSRGTSTSTTATRNGHKATSSLAALEFFDQRELTKPHAQGCDVPTRTEGLCSRSLFLV